MKKNIVFLILFALFLYLFRDDAAAERTDIIRYDDTGLVSGGDFSIYYWYPPDKDVSGSLIRNGDFQAWTDGRPDDWSIWADSKAGWEDAHIAQIDFALTEEGDNDGFGIFVRNTGGDGPYYAGAYQLLDQLPRAGNYWITTHMTMWGDTSPILYNAVGWYGIGTSEDPASVGTWRELTPLPIPCPNKLGVCLYIGRYETLYLEPGEYFHLKVGHKFPAYNDWTLFGLDDFAIVPAEGEVIEDGFWPDGLVLWDPRQLR